MPRPLPLRLLLQQPCRRKEEPPNATSLLKLLVGKPGEEKGGLGKLRKAFKKGKSFNFSRLFNEYEIDEENPISSSPVSKRLEFRFLTTHICIFFLTVLSSLTSTLLSF